jgi:hypothetical protein
VSDDSFERRVERASGLLGHDISPEESRRHYEHLHEEVLFRHPVGWTSSIPEVLTRTKSSDCPARTTRQNSVSTCGADELLGNSSTSMPLVQTRRTPPYESARKVVTIAGSARSRETAAIRTSHQLAPSTSQSKLSSSASGSDGVNKSPDPARIEVASAIRQAQAICRVYAPTL